MRLALKNRMYRTVTTDQSHGAEHGMAVLGPAPEVPMCLQVAAELPATEMDDALAVSVARLGVRVKQWTPGVVLRNNPVYLNAIRRLLEKAQISVPDLRYVVAKEVNLMKIKEVVDDMFREKVPTAEQAVAAVVAFCIKMKAALDALKDDLKVIQTDIQGWRIKLIKRTIKIVKIKTRKLYLCLCSYFRHNFSIIL